MSIITHTIAFIGGAAFTLFLSWFSGFLLEVHAKRKFEKLFLNRYKELNPNE